MTPYQNNHSDLLHRYALDADARAKLAASYSDLYAKAQIDDENAKAEFLRTLSQEGGQALATARNRRSNLSVLVEAVESAGGPKQIRETQLRTSEVFSTFAKAFAEKAREIDKLVPPALKRIAERRARLTEDGLHAGDIEADPSVRALVAYREALRLNLAEAVYSERYAAARGVSQTPQTFDQLMATLTTPLPVAPSIPSTP